MTREVNEMIEMIVKAYISVMGAEKWSGLSEREKHDVVMIIAKDLDKVVR